jgi:hypothetical protein
LIDSEKSELSSGIKLRCKAGIKKVKIEGENAEGRS